MPKTYLFHGPSGAGKDTQVEKLQEKFEFENIGTGQMFRVLLDEGLADAKKAYESWGNGKWVESGLTYKLLEEWMKKYDNNKDWILVSTVREGEQVEMLDDLLKKFGRKLDKVLHFNLSAEDAIARLSVRKSCPKCGGTFHPQWKKEKVDGKCDFCSTELVQRDDDKPEKIKNRISEWNRTIEVIEKPYKDRGLLISIDASPSIEEIHKEVLKALEL
jgi:adenylate kinase